MGKYNTNLLALPKRKDFMKCFIAPRGYNCVSLDLCFHPDTEILTDTGWKTFDKLSLYDKVMQVDKDTLEGSFVTPTRVIWKDYEGLMHVIGNKRGELSVTEGHTMLYVGQIHKTRKDKQNWRKVAKAEEGVPTLGSHFATAVTTKFGRVFPKEEIWMAAMLQADGHLLKNYSRGDKYTVQVSKPRKRAKVVELVGKTGTLRGVRVGHTLPTEYWGHIEFSSELLDKKHFNIKKICRSQRDEVFEAISFWDGHKEGNRCSYVTTVKEQAEDIQEYFVTAGYECHIKRTVPPIKHHSVYYRVTINKTDRFRLRYQDKHEYHYKGKVGCVTVPSGFVLVRNQGRCMVSGNCAIEPHVLAHFSQDRTLMEVYGKGAKPGHDIYFIAGMSIPGIKEKILPYYNLKDPDPAAIKELKEREGKLRKTLLKPAYLGWIYGIGPGTLATDLRIDKTLASKILRGMDKQFQGRHIFNMELEKKWRANNGYFINGRGRPICVDRTKKKDFVSRFNQSTGHDCLVRLLWHMSNLVQELGLEQIMVPYVPDYRDESIWLVKMGHEEEAVGVYKDALKLLNEELKWSVTVSWGEPVIAPDLTVRSED
jgi:hypothetical protein